MMLNKEAYKVTNDNLIYDSSHPLDARNSGCSAYISSNVMSVLSPFPGLFPVQFIPEAALTLPSCISDESDSMSAYINAMKKGGKH